MAGPKPGWRRVGQEAENYDIDILEISEAWWRRTGKGKLILGHIILYLGREDDWHTDAVAMIISRKVEKHSLNASKHDQDCIMLATTQSTPNWKRGIEKEDPLLWTLSGSDRRSANIWHAFNCLWPERQTRRQHRQRPGIGVHGVRTMNDNGEGLDDFYEEIKPRSSRRPFSPQEQSHVYMDIAIFLVKLLKTRMQLESWCQYQQKSNDGFSNNDVLVKYQKRNAILLRRRRNSQSGRSTLIAPWIDVNHWK